MVLLLVCAAVWAAGPDPDSAPGEAQPAASVVVAGRTDAEIVALFEQQQRSGHNAQAGRLVGAVRQAQGARGGPLLQALLDRSERDAAWEFLYAAGFVWESSGGGGYRYGLAIDSLHTLTAGELGRMYALFGDAARGSALLQAWHAVLVAGATLPQPEERERFIRVHVLHDDAHALEALTSLSFHLRLDPTSVPTQDAMVEILRRADKPLVERLLWQIDFVSHDAAVAEGHLEIHEDEVRHLPVQALDLLIERLDSWMTWVNLGNADAVHALQRVRREKEQSTVAPAP